MTMTDAGRSASPCAKPPSSRSSRQGPPTAVYDPLGLQRAPVRSIALRADALRPAERATRQFTLDAGDDKPLAI